MKTLLVLLTLLVAMHGNAQIEYMMRFGNMFYGQVGVLNTVDPPMSAGQVARDETNGTWWINPDGGNWSDCEAWDETLPNNYNVEFIQAVFLAQQDSLLWDTVEYIMELDPQVIAYTNGAERQGVRWYHSPGVVAGGSGSVTFYLTDDHLSGGDAVFPADVLETTAIVKADAPFNEADFSTLTVSGNRKSVTVTMKALDEANLTTGAIVLRASTNGTVCTLSIQGN